MVYDISSTLASNHILQQSQSNMTHVFKSESILHKSKNPIKHDTRSEGAVIYEACNYASFVYGSLFSRTQINVHERSRCGEF